MQSVIAPPFFQTHSQYTLFLTEGYWWQKTSQELQEDAQEESRSPGACFLSNAIFFCSQIFVRGYYCTGLPLQLPHVTSEESISAEKQNWNSFDSLQIPQIAIRLIFALFLPLQNTFLTHWTQIVPTLPSSILLKLQRFIHQVPKSGTWS